MIFTPEQVRNFKRKLVELRRKAEDRRDDVKRRQTYQGTAATDREVLDESGAPRTKGKEQ